MKKLFAGVKRYDMTPPKGVRLAGYPHFTRENTGYHDRLYATAVYLTDGETEFVFVTLDILFFSKKYAAEVRQRVSAQCGIPERQILICCSHTHSGPWAAGNPELEATAGNSRDIDPDYLDSLIEGVTGAIVGASGDTFEALIGFGSAHIGAESGIGGNRRDRNGICDPELNVVAVKDMTGAVRGIIANYALHPTFLHEDNLLVTADYPGYLRSYLEGVFPGAAVGFAQGTSGDQSSRYFRQGQSFEEAERVGVLMGRAAEKIICGAEFFTPDVLRHAWAELEIPIREYPPVRELKERVGIYTELYERLKASDAPYLDVQNANLKMLGAEDMLGYAICISEGRRVDLRDDENPAEISVFRIGGHIIVGYPGEVFVEYGLKVRNSGKAESIFVFELADGCLPGYCINDEAYAGDGYEAGNCMLAPGFGDTLADTALELIDMVSG